MFTVWDQIKCSRFRWLWQDVTTYSQYLSETSYENSLLAQQSGALALRSLTHVMQSLTPNARKIFQLLARYHLENASDAAYLGNVCLLFTHEDQVNIFPTGTLNTLNLQLD